MRQLVGALARTLPAGHALPHGNWVRRHNAIVALLWLHVLVVPVYGALGDAPLGHALLEAAVLGTFAVLAGTRRLRTGLRETAATLGLVSASAMLVHLSGGLIELHFHFFVMVVVVSLYQSWLPFLLALGYVVGHHGLVGMLDPEAVFNHAAAHASPWKWSLVHGFFILGQSAACLVAWRLNEDALERERTARGALEKANLDLAEAQAMAQMGSWDWDLHTGAVTWSAELYNLTGRDPETFTPTLESFLEVVHPDDRFLVAAMVEAVHVRQPHLDYECRIVRPRRRRAGRQRPGPVRDDRGRPTGEGRRGVAGHHRAQGAGAGDRAPRCTIRSPGSATGRCSWTGSTTRSPSRDGRERR